jgi:hypothetical protein
MSRLVLSQWPQLLALTLTGCAASVTADDLDAVAKPAVTVSRYEGTYRLARGSSADDLRQKLSHEADTVRITAVSPSQITITASKDGEPAGTATVPVRFDGGYLFYVVNNDQFNQHEISKLFEDTATGAAIDDDGNLFWKSQTRDVVLFLGVIPCLWSHLDRVGNAMRI